MNNGPFVIKLGGTGVEQPLETPQLWRAIVALHRSDRAAGGPGVVLVHGGGKAVDAHLDRLGHKTQRIQGLRVTPPEQAAEIAAVLAGRINKAIVAALHVHGVNAIGLCLSDGLTCRLNRITPGGNDIGMVGEVTGGDWTLLHALARTDIVPVFSPIGFDSAGHFLNVNADDAAAGIASICNSRRLVLLTDVPGLLDASGSLVARATTEEIEQMIESGVIHGGMIPKVRAAMNAAQHSGVPTLIASWSQPEQLASIAAHSSPTGTLITASPTPVPR